MSIFCKVDKTTGSKITASLFIVLYAFALYFFYIKYVPLVTSFQLVLLPILLLTFLITAINTEWGILSFVFLFPLINNLPYLFGIFENTPHAPTALVLFLFYFLGWVIHRNFSGSQSSFRYPIFKPILLFSVLVLISGIVTIFRYTNFYPFLSDSIYELITNVNGVTSGGAIMSTIFHALNYFSGFAFFIILVHSVKSKPFIKKILLTLLLSTFMTLLFGFFQHFHDLSIGNTPLRIKAQTLNSTFKDPLSFGSYLGIIIPLFFGMLLAFERWTKIIPLFVVIGAIFILPFTGSLSGLLGIVVSSLIFITLHIKASSHLKRSNPQPLKKLIFSLGILSLIFSLLASTIILTKNEKLFTKLKTRIERITIYRDWGPITGSRMVYFWEMAGIMIKDYPLSGVGIGAYIIELPNYAELHQETLRITDSAENYLLQVGSELGIVGLILSLWIFLEILKQMRVIYRDYQSSEKWNFIVIGIIAGIFSFFANFLFHTYIGSYELKYTFWLLVGLMFCLGALEKEPEEKPLFSKISKMIAILLIFIFGVSFLWNSTHSLSLKSRINLLGLKQNFGLYSTEKTDDGREFNWARDYGGLTITIEKPVIEIPLHASHPDIRENPVTVKIYLIQDFFEQKTLLDKLILNTDTWKTYEYHLPDKLNQEAILLFKVSRTWNPQKVLGVPDPRDLGIAVGKIRFRESPEIIRDNP